MQVKELQTLQPLAEGEESTDASARATEKDEAAMAARAEQTRMVSGPVGRGGRPPAGLRCNIANTRPPVPARCVVLHFYMRAHLVCGPFAAPPPPPP